MIDPFVLNILLEIVKAIVGVAIPALTVYLAFYARRINENAKRNDLQGRIDALTTHSLQAKSFELMDYESKVEAIVEGALAYAARNDISISPMEVRIMVEGSFTSLIKLERRALQIHELKLSKEKSNGKRIEK